MVVNPYELDKVGVGATKLLEMSIYLYLFFPIYIFKVFLNGFRILFKSCVI